MSNPVCKQVEMVIVTLTNKIFQNERNCSEKFTNGIVQRKKNVFFLEIVNDCSHLLFRPTVNEQFLNRIGLLTNKQIEEKRTGPFRTGTSQICVFLCKSRGKIRDRV